MKNDVMFDDIVPPEGAPQHSLIGRSATSEEADVILDMMEANAIPMPKFELTEELWAEKYGREDYRIPTPLGDVKMSDNQDIKTFAFERTDEFGAALATLNHPDVIVAVKSEAKDGKTERNSTYVYSRVFIRNGIKVEFFVSASNLKDGLEVVMSNHILRRKGLQKQMKEGKLLWTRFANESVSSGEKQGIKNSVNKNPIDMNYGAKCPQSGVPSSDNKGTTKQGQKQTKNKVIYNYKRGGRGL